MAGGAMDLKHLRNFVAVAELGSVSGAAKKLAMTQPPLTHQIKELELELGVLLLTRHPRGVSLTKAGIAFLNDAKDVLARAESARNRALHQQEAAGGFVRIGYAPSTSPVILPRLIRRMRAVRPAVKLEVREMFSSTQGRALLCNEIDVGLLRLPIDLSQLVVGVRLADPYCLAIPESHPLAGTGPIDLREAAQEIFIGAFRSQGPALFDQSLGLCADAGFSPNVRHEAPTLRGILDLVSANLGVAIVPGSMAMLAPAGVTVRPLSSPSRAGAIAFVQTRGDPDVQVTALASLAAEVFTEFGEEVHRCVARRH
jgi:DNA-binding transcriptional LysR family regulator